jgi:hypothetical protein
LSIAIERGTETKTVVRKVADAAIDCRNRGSSVYDTLGDIAAGIDPKTKEHGRAARPLPLLIGRKVAAAHHRASQSRRLDNSIVSAST